MLIRALFFLPFLFLFVCLKLLVHRRFVSCFLLVLEVWASIQPQLTLCLYMTQTGILTMTSRYTMYINNDINMKNCILANPIVQKIWYVSRPPYTWVFSVNSHKAVTCFTLEQKKKLQDFFILQSVRSNLKISQPNKMSYMCVAFLPFLSFLTGVQQSSQNWSKQ